MQNNDYIEFLKGIATKRPTLSKKVPTVIDGGGLEPLYYTQHFLNTVKNIPGMFMVIQTYDHGYNYTSDHVVKQPICRFMILASYTAQNEKDMNDKITECERESEQILAYMNKYFQKKREGKVADSFDLNQVKTEKLVVGDNKAGVGVLFILEKSHTPMLILDDKWTDLDI